MGKKEKGKRKKEKGKKERLQSGTFFVFLACF
jgi:hypothetical protein